MIVVLPVSAPHALDAAVGYEGDCGCYGLFWTPEAAGGWTVRISDGYHEWPGDRAAWHTFVGHALIAPHLARYGFAPGDDSPAMILVVDRETRVLLLYEFGAGLAFLAGQNAPWAASTDEQAGFDVEAAPDPYDSLPRTTVDLPEGLGDEQGGEALGGPSGEIPPESFDTSHCGTIPAESLPPVDALREELDRMQALGGGTVPPQ